jgi:hypothetical protein
MNVRDCKDYFYLDATKRKSLNGSGNSIDIAFKRPTNKT